MEPKSSSLYENLTGIYWASSILPMMSHSVCLTSILILSSCF